MTRPLAVLGNVNIDLILGPAEPWPQPGTEVIVEHDELRVGGAAGNTALAWEALGVDHRILASVGADAFGRWLAEAFGARAAAWTVEPTATTLSVGITHPNGERTFFTTRGHLPAFSWASAEAALTGDELDGGLLLLCGSFLMEGLTAGYGALFDWADARGIDVALDTGWPLEGWTRDVRAKVLGWLPRCRHLLLNEVETTGLAGLDDADAAAEALLSRIKSGGSVVTKLGPAGAMARAAGSAVLRCPAPAVRVVDTIGAGDVFNAGFLQVIAEGRTLAEALASGTRLASRAVSTAPRRYDPGEGA